MSLPSFKIQELSDFWRLEKGRTIKIDLVKYNKLNIITYKIVVECTHDKLITTAANEYEKYPVLKNFIIDAQDTISKKDTFDIRHTTIENRDDVLHLCRIAKFIHQEPFLSFFSRDTYFYLLEYYQVGEK
jgi:hypothetical protein